MATFDRSTAYPRAVEQLFSAAWAGFRDLDAKDRSRFAWLICATYHSRFAHGVYDDAISYHCRLRDKHFGRGRFQALNAKLRLFGVSDRWLVGAYTKAYWLTQDAQALLESVPLKTTTLVDSNGTEMRTPAQLAIHERDIDGNHRKGQGNLPAVVKVDIDAMFQLLDEAHGWRWHYKDRLPTPPGRRLVRRLAGLQERNRVQWLSDYLINPLRLTMFRADTAAMPKGEMEVTYAEYQSGRLYAVGGFMQTAAREIRSAAMHGYWDYDIENCHFSLLSQLATRVGIETPAIADYLHRKKEIRQTLADDLGVSIEGIKQALLALIYGAQRRTKAYQKNGREIEPAFVEAVGDKAVDLFEQPLFVALHHDLSKIRKPILQAMTTHKGKLYNPFGKGIPITEPPNRQLAHVVQGTEALILDAVIQRHGPDLRLLMHDGWVSAVPLDVADLERHIETATGFRVSLEQNRLE